MLRHIPVVPLGHPPDDLLGAVQLAGADEPAGGLWHEPPEAQQGQEGKVRHYLQGAPVPGQLV